MSFDSVQVKKIVSPKKLNNQLEKVLLEARQFYSKPTQIYSTAKDVCISIEVKHGCFRRVY